MGTLYYSTFITEGQPHSSSFENQMPHIYAAQIIVCHFPDLMLKWTGDWVEGICIKSHCAIEEWGGSVSHAPSYSTNIIIGVVTQHTLRCFWGFFHIKKTKQKKLKRASVSKLSTILVLFQPVFCSVSFCRTQMIFVRMSTVLYVFLLQSVGFKLTLDLAFI